MMLQPETEHVAIARTAVISFFAVGFDIFDHLGLYNRSDHFDTKLPLDFVASSLRIRKKVEIF